MENVDLIDFDDLELVEIDVTTLRDTVALPETAASSGHSYCAGGSCTPPEKV